MHNPNPRTPQATTVPLDASVLETVLPAVAAALEGGLALLPLPAGPALLRDSIEAALRPDLPVEDGVALVVPTSGSTGTPKGVLLTTDAIRASAEATYARLGGTGRWLLALPATHVAGLMVLARSVLAGTTPVVLDLADGFDPESFAAASVRLIAASGSRRYTALVPRQLAAILDAGSCAVEALAAYNAVLLGGSAVPSELAEQARAAGVRLVTTYGMSETCGGCVYDGVPLDGVKVETADDGRIRLAGPVLARGYRLRPDLTADAFDHGWFVTADAGRFGLDGRLDVTGRMDDVAVTGGVNVPLAAVDAAVADHPQVAEACAVALPDAEWGERIAVALIAAAPGEPPTLDAIRAHVLRGLPAAYAPKELTVVDDLPRLPGEKIDRPAVTARLLQRHRA
jgi:o-succinylbenzoate---CoA ligase